MANAGGMVDSVGWDTDMLCFAWNNLKSDHLPRPATSTHQANACSGRWSSHS
jgi:hypothetical protein